MQRNITVDNCTIQCVDTYPTPTTHTPHTTHTTHTTPMCRCGKPFVGECRIQSLFTNSRVIDETRLAQCKTPEERRALISDPNAWFIIDSTLHGPMKIAQ